MNYTLDQLHVHVDQAYLEAVFSEINIFTLTQNINK